MASHFSTIGFNIETETAFSAMTQQAANEGQSYFLEDGSRYIHFQAGDDGIELWVQVSADNHLLGINPHFSGEAVMRTGLVDRIKRIEDSPMDGAFKGWANPINDPVLGQYQLVFDSPDFGLLGEVETPSIYDVQLTGFAHELRAFWSEQAYLDAQTGDEPKLEAESFIPSGLFDMNGERTAVPKATAYISGVVLETKKLTNPISNIPFHWAKVKTLGGEIDIVADPEIVQGMLKAGGIVRGACWVSGRIWEE